MFCKAPKINQNIMVRMKEVLTMAKCAVCDKNINFGNQLSITRSHISKRSTRTFKPNLRTVKAIVDGQPKRITVCAKCLRSGKVTRA